MEKVIAMTDQLIILSKEECHQFLINFYETVANKLDIPIDENCRFDCRHIYVTEFVQKELCLKMEEDGWSDPSDISSFWLSFGPKANIHVISDEPFFAARVEDGFIIFSEGD